MAGFVPIGFAKSAAGEYTFSIFAVVSIAVLASWLVAVIFIPLLGVALLTKPKAAHRPSPARSTRVFRNVLVAAMRMRWLTILMTLACFVYRPARRPLCAEAVLPVIGPAGTAGRSAAAAKRFDLRQPMTCRPSSTRFSRAIPTSHAGAPMSGAARSGSICRSASSCRTISSASSSSSRRTSPPASGFARSWNVCSRRSSRVR